MNELIVTFKTGVPEGIARAAVQAAGGVVRRRMRTDSPNEVMLLVKVGTGSVEELEAKMKKLPSVNATEKNEAGFSAR